MSPRANQHQRMNIADLKDQKREKVKKRVRTSKEYLKKIEFQMVKIVKNFNIVKNVKIKSFKRLKIVKRRYFNKFHMIQG